jgi:hypothetical protein
MPTSDDDARRAGSSAGESGSFRVDDQRRFDPRTGERREGAPDTPLPGGGVLSGAGASAEETELPVGFGDLVQPFLLIGLTGLGILPHPETNQAEVNLKAAAAAIDSLELLKTRTEGNRTAEETRLLEQALYELKMQFVEARERSRRG